MPNILRSSTRTFLLQYDSAGSLRWSAEQVDADHVLFGGLAVFQAGGAVLAGYTDYHLATPRLITTAYDADGVERWTESYDGPLHDGASAADVAIDATGSVYVAGTFNPQGSPYGFLALKYSPAGDLIWTGTYRGAAAMPGGVPRRIAIGPLGDVFLTGKVNGVQGTLDYGTVRFDANGVLRWVARYDGGSQGYDEAHGMCLDTFGSVYITGESAGLGTNVDFATIKYGPPPPSCPSGDDCRMGDVNGDCVVNLTDITLLLSNFGLDASVGIAPANGDLDFSGAVSLADLTLLLSAFGSDCR